MDEQQSTNKKAKIDDQLQPGPEVHTMTRKRLREELEGRIGDLRSHQASAREEESKRTKAKRNEAVFEAEPQLPGRKDGAKEILERLRGRSEKIGDKNSSKPCKKNQVHERGAITRLLNGGGGSSTS